MLSEVKRYLIARFSAGFQSRLQEASTLVSASLRGAATIRQDLDVALDLVNVLRNANDDEKAEILEKYTAVLGAVDQHARAAQYQGKSLVDGSEFDWTLSERGRMHWVRKLDHHALTAGSEGLDLPRASTLDNRDILCDDAQGVLAGAIKQVNRTIVRLENHQKAIAEKLKDMDQEVRLGAEALHDEAREGTREIAQIVGFALLIAIVFRSFVFQPFHIPSGSMKSTLLKGDYLFVSKYAYGYSSKSLPFGIDFFDGRVLSREPRRGDVIVFKLTRDGRTDYIKRLVGLPGDKIQMKNGQLYINDVAVPKETAGQYLYTDDLTGETRMVPSFRETLPNGVMHTTLDLTALGRNDNTSVYRVPDEHYFFMGDNRDNSQDSRVIGGGVGFVPAENLVGRAEMIFLSVDGSARIWQVWRWPFAIRYSRMFNSIE